MIDKRSHKDENIIELLKQYGYTYISGKYKKFTFEISML